MTDFITRFAPSPTGPLHLGHAYSAIIAAQMAAKANGRFLLRIEDIDFERCRPNWEALIYEDMAWLGLSWDRNVLRQSEQLQTYNEYLKILTQRGLIYPCSCSRNAIKAAQSAPQEGVKQHATYPGTCRNRPMSSRKSGDALRLNMSEALKQTQYLSFTETGSKYMGQHKVHSDQLINEIGDAVVGRKDPTTISYALASVIDDAHQKITHVVRGEDLFDITMLQVLLQSLLNFHTPTYHHHKLVRDENGKRLAKRDDARAISTYRTDGNSPKDIRALIGL